MRRRRRLLVVGGRGDGDRGIEGIAGNGVESRVVEEIKDFEVLELVLRRVVSGDLFEDGIGTLRNKQVQFVGTSSHPVLAFLLTNGGGRGRVKADLLIAVNVFPDPLLPSCTTSLRILA